MRSRAEEPAEARAGSGVLEAATAHLATLGLAPIRLALGRSRVGRWVLAANRRAALVAASIVSQERSAARTAALLGEQGVERRGRVDLAAARPAGELRHARILAVTGSRGNPDDGRLDWRRSSTSVGGCPDRPERARWAAGSPLWRPAGHPGRWSVAGRSVPRSGPLSFLARSLDCRARDRGTSSAWRSG